VSELVQVVVTHTRQAGPSSGRGPGVALCQPPTVEVWLNCDPLPASLQFAASPPSVSCDCVGRMPFQKCEIPDCFISSVGKPVGHEHSPFLFP
jgi:hypothetical protein